MTSSYKLYEPCGHKKSLEFEKIVVNESGDFWEVWNCTECHALHAYPYKPPE